MIKHPTSSSKVGKLFILKEDDTAPNIAVKDGLDVGGEQVSQPSGEHETKSSIGRWGFPGMRPGSHVFLASCSPAEEAVASLNRHKCVC